MANTIVAMITTNLSRAQEPTHLLIDLNTTNASNPVCSTHPS
jgi:hypothetical protein